MKPKAQHFLQAPTIVNVSTREHLSFVKLYEVLVWLNSHCLVISSFPSENMTGFYLGEITGSHKLSPKCGASLSTLPALHITRWLMLWQ